MTELVLVLILMLLQQTFHLITFSLSTEMFGLCTPLNTVTFKAEEFNTLECYNVTIIVEATNAHECTFDHVIPKNALKFSFV